MKRFKIICISIALIVFTAVLCSCTANPNAVHSGYNIERVYKYNKNSMAIYKVKTPSFTYTVLRDQTGGMVILK